MKEILIYNEQTHSLDNMYDFPTATNGDAIQVDIPAIFTKQDLEYIKNALEIYAVYVNKLDIHFGYKVHEETIKVKNTLQKIESLY